MRKVPNTVSRNGKYTFQQGIPAEVRHHFEGKSLVQIPLHTSDPDQALVAVAHLKQVWKSRIEAARRGENTEAVNSEFYWTDDPTKQVFPGEDVQAGLQRIRAAAVDDANWMAEAYKAAKWYLGQAGVELTPEQTDLFEGALASSQRQTLLAGTTSRRLITGAPAPIEAAAAPPEQPKLVVVAQVDPNNPTLSQVFAQRGAQFGRAKSYEAEKSIRQFEELFDPIGVKDITPTHMRRFRDALLALPLKLPNAESRRPLPELLEIYKDHGGPRPTNTTVKAKLSPISSTLTYAVDEGIIESNPATGIKSTGGRASTKRPPFDRGHLETIFALPLFSEKVRSEEAWFHILSVYTGARPAEVIQLDAADIKKMPNGIDGHYIDVHAYNDDNSLKTDNSIRRVPIHPGLEASGFIKWARSRSGLLFPSLQNGDGERRQKSDRASKLGNALIHDDAGIPAPWCLYSYRHMMQDAGRDSGLDRGTIDAFVGREDQTSGGGYGNGYSIAILAEAVSRIKLPADLSHLNR